MTIECSHLSPSARECVLLSDDERISFCKKKFYIHTDFAARVIEDSRRIVSMASDSGTVGRVLVGPTGVGKSTLVTALAAKLNSTTKTAVLVCDLSPRGKEMDLRKIFYTELGFSQSPEFLNSPSGRKLVRARIKELGLKLWIWDEGDGLIHAHQAAGNNKIFLRAVMNDDIGLSQMLAGTSELLGFLNKSNSLPSRFGRINMEEWGAESESFSRFLAGYIRYLPLKKPSKIDTFEIQKLLTVIGGHNTRGIKHILIAAAVYAIEHGIECITEDVIRGSNADGLVFYAPDGGI